MILGRGTIKKKTGSNSMDIRVETIRADVECPIYIYLFLNYSYAFKICQLSYTLSIKIYITPPAPENYFQVRP